MKNFFLMLLTAFAVIWTLPQTLLGGFIVLVSRAAYMNEKDFARIYVSKWLPYMSGVSLGFYIIFGGDKVGNVRVGFDDVNHEYGHCLQSLILGPLYILVIGIPSFLWAWFICKWTGRDYYWFYTERWADKLGGVYRPLARK